MRFVTALFSLAVSVQAMAAGNTLELRLENLTTVDAVPAQVQIQDGQVISSNCKALTEKDPDGIQFRLEEQNGKMMCVPSVSTRTSWKPHTLTLEHEATVEGLRKRLQEASDDLAQRSSHQIASQVEATCLIDKGGQVVLQTCQCPSAIYDFVSEKMTCVINPLFVSLTVPRCTVHQRGIAELLNAVGVRADGATGSINSCSGFTQMKYSVAPALVVYKMLYFAYFKQDIAESLKGKAEFSDLRLSITKAELREYDQWSKAFLVENQGNRKLHSELRVKIPNLQWNLSNKIVIVE